MKKYILASFFAAGTTLAFGQNVEIQKDTTKRFNALEYALQTNRRPMMFDKNPIAANTYFKFGFGGASLINVGNTTKIKPFTDIEVGKWITPINGVSIAYKSGYTNDLAYSLFGANYLFNVLNFAERRNRERNWDIYLKVGAQIGSADHEIIYGANIATQISRKLTRNLSVYVEPQFSALNNKLDGKDNWSGFDGQMSLSAGVMYKMLNHELRVWNTSAQGWFAQTAYGISFLYGNDRGNLSQVAGAARFSYGKWLIPSSALRLNLTAYNVSNDDFIPRKEDKELLVNSLGLDYILNLNQLTGGEKDNFELNLLAGAEVGYSANKRFNSLGFMYGFGAQAVYNMGEYAVFGEWNSKFNVKAFSKTNTISDADRIGVFFLGLAYNRKQEEWEHDTRRNLVYLSGGVNINMISSVWEEKHSRTGAGGGVKYGRNFNRNIFRVGASFFSIPSASEADQNRTTSYVRGSFDYMYQLTQKHVEISPLIGVITDFGVNDETGTYIGFNTGVNISVPISGNISLYTEPKLAITKRKKYEEALRRYDETLGIDFGLIFKW